LLEVILAGERGERIEHLIGAFQKTARPNTHLNESHRPPFRDTFHNIITREFSTVNGSVSAYVPIVISVDTPVYLG
jgi:hypothetical protein